MPAAPLALCKKTAQDARNVHAGGECAEELRKPPPRRRGAPPCVACTATQSDYARKDEQEMFHPTGTRGLECFALPMPLTDAAYSAVRTILPNRRIAVRNGMANSVR